MNISSRTISQEQFLIEIRHIANQRPEWAAHFGVEGCDLYRPNYYWAVYGRQSDEGLQAENNMRREYMADAAAQAAALGVIVPIEYILYEFHSGADGARDMLGRIRFELFPRNALAGIIFPKQDRLTREPFHLMVFRQEAIAAGVQLYFIGGVNGPDFMSEMMQQNMAYMAKWVRRMNCENSLKGRQGHVRDGNVPTGEAPTGYRYRREGKRTWYEIDGLRDGVLFPEGGLDFSHPGQVDEYLVSGSPAWCVAMCFYLCTVEGMSSTQVAHWLTERGVMPPGRGNQWYQGNIARLCRNSTYTGVGYFNRTKEQVNPRRPRPLDLLEEPKRTVTRLKPETEWQTFTCPALITPEVLEQCRERFAYRLTHRGASTPSYPALLRDFIYCPNCGRKMRVWSRPKSRNKDGQRTYYYRCDAYCSEVKTVRDSCGKEYPRMCRLEDTDALARELLKYYATHPELIERAIEQHSDRRGEIIAADIRRLRVTIEEKRGRQRRLVNAISDGHMLAADAGEVLAQLRTELEEYGTRLAQAEAGMAAVREQEMSWEEIRETMQQQRIDDLDNDDNCRRFMKRLGAYYIPAGPPDDVGFHLLGVKLPRSVTTNKQECCPLFYGDYALHLSLAVA